MANHSYFVVAIDYGRRGIEAIVDPEITRREVVSRLRSGEYRDVSFIHHIHDGICEVVTDELIEAAGMPEENVREIDLKVIGWDRKLDREKETA